jgi:hypothetical protein
MKGAAKHDSRGIIAMANKGAATNGYGIVHERLCWQAYKKKLKKVTMVHYVQSDTTP